MKSLLVVSKYTFLEVYRSKVMLSILFLGFGLLVLSYVASEFAYGAPTKVALDVGFGIMSLSNLVISIFIGSTLLAKEIEQKTIYMVISRPISRTSFLFGKMIGLSSVLLINTLVLGILSCSLYLFFGGQWQDLFVWTIYFSFIEALFIMSFAVLFSLITNTTLSVILSLSIFVTGHAINETSKLFFTKNSIFFDIVVKCSSMLIPNFYRLNLKDFVLYKQNVSSEYLVSTNAYALFYLSFLLVILLNIFRTKSLD